MSQPADLARQHATSEKPENIDRCYGEYYPLAVRSETASANRYEVSERACLRSIGCKNATKVTAMLQGIAPSAVVINANQKLSEGENK